MGYCQQTSLPSSELITLATAKQQLRVDSSFTADDALIGALISAAREHAEMWTGRAIAQRTFRMVLDSAPYYTDTIQSQLAYPPSYYSLPLYATTLWNYSQMIKLPFPPVVSVQQMRYIDSNGEPQTLNQDTDFILDRISEPARIFPNPVTLQNWPPSLYVANALEIDFTAGYVPAPGNVDTHNVVTGPWIAFQGDGTGAAADAVVAGGAFAGIANIVGGSGYTRLAATVNGGGGNGGSFTPVLTGGALSGAANIVGGSGYSIGTPNQQPDSVLVTGAPYKLVQLMLILIGIWYDNRQSDIPDWINRALQAHAVVDWAPTRG